MGKTKLGRRALLAAAAIAIVALVSAALFALVERDPGPDPRHVSDLADISAGGHLKLQNRVYETKEPVSVPPGSVIDGNGATIRYSGGGPAGLSLDSNVKLSNVRIVATDHSKAVVRVPKGSSEVSLKSVDVLGSKTQHSGIEVEGDSSDVQVEDGRVSGVRNGVQVFGRNEGMTLHRLRIDEWTHRGIRVQGGGGGASKELTISHVSIGSNVDSGGSRQPIIVRSPDDSRHKDLRITDTSVTGRGTSFSDRSDPGTGDQISVVNTDGLLIEDCRSVDGGERGLNVTDASDVIVRGNYIKGSDTVGIGIGSSAKDKAVSDVRVEDNDVEDSGTATMEDTTDYSLSGIRLTNVSGGALSANTIRKSTDSSKPKYGIVVDQSKAVTVKESVIEGDFARAIFDGGGNQEVQLQDDQ